MQLMRLMLRKREERHVVKARAFHGPKDDRFYLFTRRAAKYDNRPPGNIHGFVVKLQEEPCPTKLLAGFRKETKHNLINHKLVETLKLAPCGAPNYIGNSLNSCQRQTYGRYGLDLVISDHSNVEQAFTIIVEAVEIPGDLFLGSNFLEDVDPIFKWKQKVFYWHPAGPSSDHEHSQNGALEKETTMANAS